MKSKEELNALNEEEIAQVSGGAWGHEGTPGNWQDSDGKTSGIVKDNDCIWLHEQSFDSSERSSAWYGLENSVG